MRGKGMGEEETRTVSVQEKQSPGREPYTSPPSKLVRLFAQSRDRWKAKCRGRQRDDQAAAESHSVFGDEPRPRA